MQVSSAFLLVAHGSHDPRPQIALDHLSKLVAARLLQSSVTQVGQAFEQAYRQQGIRQPPLVGTAVLELAPLPLHQQICQFAQQAMACGYEIVQIVPLFLLAGVHVMEDIPAEVALARQQLQNLQQPIEIDLCPHLGSLERLWQLLLNPVEPMLTDAHSGKVVIAHGSRRAAGNQVIEQVAIQLGALPAYWSVAPSLETQVTELIKCGHQQIAILPYFLFEGGITDAIRQTVMDLSQQFPYAQLRLTQPIGATPALAERILELIIETALQKLR